MRREFDWFPVIIAAFIIFAVVSVAVGIMASKQYEENCQARGGHVHTVDTSGYAWVNGKYQYVSSSYSQCLTSDGRIVEI